MKFNLLGFKRKATSKHQMTRLSATNQLQSFSFFIRNMSFDTGANIALKQKKVQVGFVERCQDDVVFCVQNGIGWHQTILLLTAHYLDFCYGLILSVLCLFIINPQ